MTACPCYSWYASLISYCIGSTLTALLLCLLAYSLSKSFQSSSIQLPSRFTIHPSCSPSSSLSIWQTLSITLKTFLPSRAPPQSKSQRTSLSSAVAIAASTLACCMKDKLRERSTRISRLLRRRAERPFWSKMRLAFSSTGLTLKKVSRCRMLIFLKFFYRCFAQQSSSSLQTNCEFIELISGLSRRYPPYYSLASPDGFSCRVSHSRTWQVQLWVASTRQPQILLLLYRAEESLFQLLSLEVSAYAPVQLTRMSGTSKAFLAFIFQIRPCSRFWPATAPPLSTAYLRPPWLSRPSAPQFTLTTPCSPPDCRGIAAFYQHPSRLGSQLFVATGLSLDSETSLEAVSRGGGSFWTFWPGGWASLLLSNYRVRAKLEIQAH